MAVRTSDDKPADQGYSGFDDDLRRVALLGDMAMTSPPRRYTAEDVQALAEIASKASLFIAQLEVPLEKHPERVGLDPRMLAAILKQAAEDALRLEQMEKILSLDVELRQHDSKDYQLGWNAASDTLKAMLLSAGRREAPEGR